MTRLAGWVLAGGLLLSMAASAKAQGIVIGNPYAGRGIAIGNVGYGGYGGYGYGNSYGYGVPATRYYSSGYNGYYAAPAVTTYSTTTYAYPSYGYRTYGAYPGYGYGGGYGYRRGGFLRRY